jgi:hypothetical protein
MVYNEFRLQKLVFEAFRVVLSMKNEHADENINRVNTSMTSNSGGELKKYINEPKNAYRG